MIIWLHCIRIGWGPLCFLALAPCGPVVASAPSPSLLLAGQGLVYGRLEAPDVLDGQRVCLRGRARPDELVQGGEDLRVEHLEATDAVHHALQLLERESKRL